MSVVYLKMAFWDKNLKGVISIGWQRFVSFGSVQSLCIESAAKSCGL